MLVKGKNVRIIQIFPMENTQTWQGHILGLGDDGVVYVDTHSCGKSGWEVYTEDKFIGEGVA